MALTKGSTGYGSCVPVKTMVSFKGASGGGGGEGSYQNTSRFSYSDKQSGSYGSVTNKEKASAGDFQWKNGTTGTKTEYKQSSTVRFGDENGYTEVYNEQRVRNVAYDKSGCNSKNYITYDSDDGGPFGGVGPYGGYVNGGGSYGGYVNGSEGGGPYAGYGSEDGGLYGGYVNDSDDGGPYGGFGYGIKDDGPYGDFGYEIEDDGPYGGFDYGNDDDGMYSYDSDY